MRKKPALAAIGLAAAAALAPINPASAYCDATYRAMTGYCNPCDHANAVTHRPMTCLD